MCLTKNSRRKFLADALFWAALPTVGVVALAHVSPAAAAGYKATRAECGHLSNGLNCAVAGCWNRKFNSPPDAIKTVRLHKANKGTHRKPLARPAQPAKTGGRG